MKTFFLSFLVLFSAASEGAYDPKHAIWNQIVSARVKDGIVDYPGVKTDSEKLDQYVAQLGEVTAEEYGKWSRDDQMAYLINAYNAFTVRLITDFYPVESIRDIGAKVGGGLFNKKSKQWKVSEYETGTRKVTFKAMGKPITLDEIEHENLRPTFKDARVHFALVCGAVSCPFLRSEAYLGSRLNEQLDAQGKQFLADPFRNRYEPAKNTLHLSKIFDWFSGDFKKDGDLYSFVKKYLPAPVLSQIKDKPEIEYLDYDWSLNSKAGKLN